MYLYLLLYHWQLKLAACVHRTCTNICSAGVRFITQALQTCSKAPPTVS